MHTLIQRGMSNDEIAAANPTRTYNERLRDPEAFLRAPCTQNLEAKTDPPLSSYWALREQSI